MPVPPRELRRTLLSVTQGGSGRKGKAQEKTGPCREALLPSVCGHAAPLVGPSPGGPRPGRGATRRPCPGHGRGSKPNRNEGRTSDAASPHTNATEALVMSENERNPKHSHWEQRVHRRSRCLPAEFLLSALSVRHLHGTWASARICRSLPDLPLPS